MSKASEYAKKHAEAVERRPPDLVLEDEEGEKIEVAMVRDDGRLVFNPRPFVSLSEEQAVALAKWIIETFGEPHVCDLPDSIKEALNSGDGTYRP